MAAKNKIEKAKEHEISIKSVFMLSFLFSMVFYSLLLSLYVIIIIQLFG